MVQLTRGSLVALAGLLLLLGVAGVVVVACGASDRDGSIRIEDLQAPTPSNAREGASARRQPVPTPPPTPPPPRSVFETQQVLAYYGNPYSATMGILGEYENKQELVARIRDQAARHQAHNPEKTVIPALHLIYAVAQARPGAEGTYLIHMPDEMVEEFIELTRQNNMLFFIDLQNGMANPVAEVKRVLHWLRHEHVHLAMDPEFTLVRGQNPQDYIGSLDGATINQIQDLLQQLALESRIGNKIFIIHQFRPSMITSKELIAKDRDRVDVVINMDGWGGPEGKLSKWQAHIVNEPVEYAGIKLFYRWDKPLLTEAEVQGLTPRPNYIQYQ